MPTFNKDVYKRSSELIEYEAKPTDKYRTISSIFRIYRPYAPGDRVNFSLKIKSLNGMTGALSIMCCENGEEPFVIMNIGYTGEQKIITIPPSLVRGQGSIDYYMKSLGHNESVLLVSVVPSHNDAVMFLIMGGVITLVVEVLAILIATVILGWLK